MPPADTTLIAANRRARRNYDISETVEAGIVLHGSEVKSLREATVQIADGFVRFEGREAWLQGVHIAPYLFSQDHSGTDQEIGSATCRERGCPYGKFGGGAG